MSIASSAETPSRRGAWTLVTLAVAAACVATACWAWSRSIPALGERPYGSSRIGGARFGALAIWATGQALLLGIAVPMIYRKRPSYLAMAGVLGLVATLAAITAGALLAASSSIGR